MQNDEGFQRAWAKYGDELSVAQWLTGPPQMQPVSAAITWNVPAFDSPSSLAEWLGLTVGELFYFADVKGLGHKSKSADSDQLCASRCGESEPEAHPQFRSHLQGRVALKRELYERQAPARDL